MRKNHLLFLLLQASMSDDDDDLFADSDESGGDTDDLIAQSKQKPIAKPTKKKIKEKESWRAE